MARKRSFAWLAVSSSAFFCRSSLEALAFGDIADGAGYELPVPEASGLKLISTRKLAAVLASAVQLEADAHRPDARLVAYSPRCTTWRVRNRSGTNELDGSADQVLPAVAEQLFGLSVDELHPPRSPTMTIASERTPSVRTDFRPVGNFRSSPKLISTGSVPRKFARFFSLGF